MAHVDSGRKDSQGGPYIACDIDGDTGRNEKDEDRQRNKARDFGRKACVQADMMSITWVTTCPKEHIALNARQFHVVAQTYFGVGQTCLTGLIGQTIRQKARRGKKVREMECDAYGEKMVKATLLGA